MPGESDQEGGGGAQELDNRSSSLYLHDGNDDNDITTTKKGLSGMKPLGLGREGAAGLSRRWTSMSHADTMKWGALLVLIVQNASVALTMRYSRTSGGEYLTSTAVVTTECVKLIAVCLFIAYEERGVGGLVSKLHREIVLMPYDFAKLLIPAALYTALNNLAFLAISNLDAATYQVLSQLKILVTALFSVIILRTHLSCYKWSALCILVVGVALVQVSGLKQQDSQKPNNNNIVGFVAVVMACTCSGFAGVYFEKILKGSDVSIWVRNVELAVIGIVLGLGNVWYNDMEAVREHGFFFGYKGIVWAVVGLQAVGGIIVAIVVKYADNILKGFATSVAIIISCLVSYAFLGEFNLSSKFFVGLVLVILSVMMYNTNPAEVCCVPSSASSNRLAISREHGDSLIPLRTLEKDDKESEMEEPTQCHSWKNSTTSSLGVPAGPAIRIRALPA